MRVAAFVLVIGIVSALPASARAQAGAWEFGIGPNVALREDSTVHSGGGITFARRSRTLAAVLEASGTRRRGHNDWRLVGGPRVALGTTGRSAFFAQVLAGTLIRQRDADWAVLPGAGVDVRWTDWSAVRVQIDAPVERSEARTAKSARASVWLTFY